MLYIVEEPMYLLDKLGMAIRFDSSSSMNGSHEMFGCKSFQLSCVHSIEDGALKFSHVTREE